jgi:hypothetical protein
MQKRSRRRLVRVLSAGKRLGGFVGDRIHARLSDKVVSVLVGVGRCPDRGERKRWVHRRLLGGGGCDPVLVELEEVVGGGDQSPF